MFDEDSRYYGLPDRTMQIKTPGAPDRQLVYKSRRLLPPLPPESESAAPASGHEVNGTDRLDTLAARYMGDPMRFWVLCDLNDALHPKELVAEVGRVLRIERD